MVNQKRPRRGFSAECKLEAVRRIQERRSSGISLAQIGREVGVTPALLRAWTRQAEARVGAAPLDVFLRSGSIAR